MSKNNQYSLDAGVIAHFFSDNSGIVLYNKITGETLGVDERKKMKLNGRLIDISPAETDLINYLITHHFIQSNV